MNALYHRDYTEREPVEITIEPHQISILSYAGPDRSISKASIKEAKFLRSRRYRNRRLGEFLKELELTEGRATGIPTIQKALLDNGSGKATIETDEDRSYFLIDIPCHPLFAEASYNLLQDESVHQLFTKCSDKVKSLIISIKDKEMSTGELQVFTRCAPKSKPIFIKTYIAPAIRLGLLAPLYPNSRNHPRQKYRLTDKGKEILAMLENE